MAMLVIRQQQNADDAEKRQEGQDREDRKAGHHAPPLENRNQVTKAATPISIAKA